MHFKNFLHRDGSKTFKGGAKFGSISLKEGSGGAAHKTLDLLVTVVSDRVTKFLST